MAVQILRHSKALVNEHQAVFGERAGVGIQRLLGQRHEEGGLLHLGKADGIVRDERLRFTGPAARFRAIGLALGGVFS